MGALAVIALLGFGLAREGDGGVDVGEPLPQTALLPLDPTLSAAYTLDDYQGRWVLVNVWASWCGPCRDEAPALERFARRHQGEVDVVGIATQDTSEDGLAFVEEFGLTYDQLHDGSGDYAEEIGTTGVPESILLDPEGKVADYVPGPVTEDILSSRIEPLVEGRDA